MFINVGGAVEHRIVDRGNEGGSTPPDALSKCRHLTQTVSTEGTRLASKRIFPSPRFAGLARDDVKNHRKRVANESPSCAAHDRKSII